MSPLGDSQVTSMTLLALVSRFWSGSATTQSSLHQPGSCATPSQVSVCGAPSTSTVIEPALTSSRLHEIGPPFLCGSPSLTQSKGQELHFASMNWYVGPLSCDRTW